MGFWINHPEAHFCLLRIMTQLDAFSQDRQSKRLRKRYGSWAIVTGASSGIGHALAMQLGAAGLNVVLVARREDQLYQVAAELEKTSRVETLVVSADLSTHAGITAVEDKTADLDVGLLIANAGFGTIGRFLDTPISAELAMLNVNCRALMQLSHTFGNRFSKRGRGGIILVSSVLAMHGVPNAAHYAATKAYVLSLAEGLHVELAPKKVDVLATAPGPTSSGFAKRASMNMGLTMSPDLVAAATLGALGRRSTVFPGNYSKFIVYGMRLLPRWMRIRLMGLIVQGMIRG